MQTLHFFYSLRMWTESFTFSMQAKFQLPHLYALSDLCLVWNLLSCTFILCLLRKFFFFTYNAIQFFVKLVFCCQYDIVSTLRLRKVDVFHFTGFVIRLRLTLKLTFFQGSLRFRIFTVTKYLIELPVSTFSLRFL